MNLKFKTFVIFIGDIVILYGSLVLALLIRYGAENNFSVFSSNLTNHLAPFSLIFAVWVIVFYLTDLYDPRNFKNNINFFKNFGLTLLINGFLAVLFFYLIPIYGITPKTNLLIFLIIFGVLSSLWRYIFNYLSGTIGSPEKILIIKPERQNIEVENLIDFINHNSQLGYKIEYQLKESNLAGLEMILTKKFDIAIITTHLQEKAKITKMMYKNFSGDYRVINFSEFYELIFKKVPLSELEESWFFENLIKRKIFYDPLKIFSDLIMSLILFFVIIPISLIIFLIIKLTSKGSAVYKQIRTGKKEKDFLLYKFRTMSQDAEKQGPQWAGENDPRITPIGKILRRSHLDEIPQLINIIKGNISFVGPRPERPEFISLLKEKVPYYEIRHLIKPGLTGWAQINYRYGSSIEDAYEKLQYDIYYLKNRSFVLDLLIILKTIKSVFSNPK